MHSRNLLAYAFAAAFICGTYPLALVGHFAVDVLHGDAEIVRDALYGYQSLLAAELVSAWLGSLLWVIAIWAVVELQRRLIPGLYAAVTVAAAVALLGLGITAVAPIPPIFGWLLLAALALHSVSSRVRTKVLGSGEPCAA